MFSQDTFYIVYEPVLRYCVMFRSKYYLVDLATLAEAEEVMAAAQQR